MDRLQPQLKSPIITLCLAGTLLLLCRPCLGSHLATSNIGVGELAQIEAQTIQSRRSLAAGRIVARLEWPSQIGTNRRPVRYEFHFQGTKLRVDLHGESVSERPRSTTICDEYRLIRVPPNEGWVQLLPRPDRNESCEIPDPRLLGLVAWNFETVGQFGYEKDLVDASHRNVRVEQFERAGEPLLRVSFERPGTSGVIHSERVLSPRFDNFPVHIAHWITHGDGENAARSGRTMDCELERFPGASSPYPRRVVLRTILDGKVRESEVVTIEDAYFGDVDHNMFTLAGTGIAKGRVVDTVDRQGTWDGNSIVYKPGSETLEPEPAEQHRIRWLLLSNAIFLAFVAAIVLLRWTRTRNPPDKSKGAKASGEL